MANERRVITYCGECGNYSYKLHKCLIGANEESNPQNPFYDNCPLPKATEIGHCKDCRHMTIEQGLRYCNLWERFNGAGDDGFCNYWERRCE